MKQGHQTQKIGKASPVSYSETFAQYNFKSDMDAGSAYDSSKNQTTSQYQSSKTPQQQSEQVAKQQSVLLQNQRNQSQSQNKSKQQLSQEQTVPSKAFEEAFRKGSNIMPDMDQEKQMYVQQQEIERMREDNILLKADNERMVKLLYSKEKDVSETYHQEIDVKDKQIQQMDQELEHQRKLIEELRLELVSKQLDRDNLKAQLINKSFSPLLFLNDYSRNEFWKMITRYESDAIGLQDDKFGIQQQIQEQRSIIGRQEAEINELKKQVEDNYTIRREYQKLKQEYDKLHDKYTDVEHSFKEINLKYTGIEKSYHFQDKERDQSHQRIQELTNLLHERSVESNNEKKALREFLSRLEQEKGLAEDANKRDKDFSSYRVAKVSRPFNLSDYFIRLKTTSISSDKYAETIDILYELFKTEQANALKNSAKLDQSSATAQLKLKDHYKLFLKAFSSKNTKVLHTTYKLVRELGDLEDRVAEFIENQASASLIKTYKTTDDYTLKQETLYFLKFLCDVSETVAIEVSKYGATQTIIDDLRKYTRGVNILSHYLVDLLEFMSKVCKFNQGFNEFISPSCMGSLVLCLQSEKSENKIHSMNCIVFLARTPENRTALSNYDVFNIVMTNLIRSVESKDRQVSYAAVGALAYFSFERAYRILLANANQMFNFYELLLQCISGVTVNNIDVPASTRYAASAVISKMLSDKDLYGVHDAIMKEGVLTYLSKGLRDKQSSVKKECAQIIIHLSKYIENKPESFRPLINPLISALSDDDSTLIIRSLDCLRTLAFNETLRDFIVDNGCVSILCSIIVQELSDIAVEVLKHSVSLLVVLTSNQEARQIMYEANVILPILGFLSSDDIEIRALWYEGVKELGAYLNFRSQLENAENSMLLVKRAIRTGEQTFLLQLIAVVRVLCQSPILLERLIDPVVIPKLFDIYNSSLKWVDANVEIYIIQTLRLLFSSVNGKVHVLKNEQMLSYITSCLSKENVNVANEAASLLIEILQETHQSLQVFSKIPIVNNLLIYSKINNATAIQKSTDIAKIIRSIPFLYNEYRTKVENK